MLIVNNTGSSAPFYTPKLMLGMSLVDAVLSVYFYFSLAFLQISGVISIVCSIRLLTFTAGSIFIKNYPYLVLVFKR
jgi:hypothetical protein